MTVATQVSKVTAPGNGAATSFSFSPVVIFATTDLEVTHVDAVGTETLLVEGTGSTNYSVAVASFPGTGNVIYPADEVTPLPNGQSLIINRVLTIEQLTNLENQGGYFPEVQEAAFDKGVMISQQLAEESARSIKIPVSSLTSIDTELTTVVANEFLKWNSAGDAIVSSPTTAGVATASSASPAAVNSTGAVIGTGVDYSREDHEHTIDNDDAMRTHLDVPKLSGNNTFGGGSQTIRVTESGAGSAIQLNLTRKSVTPAVDDILADFRWRGDDDAVTQNEVIYGQIRGRIQDPTEASTDGKLQIMTAIGGSVGVVAEFATGMWTVNATGGDQGRDTINAKGYYLDGATHPPAASDSVAGVIEKATEAEMETGTTTNRCVVPGRQHRHVSASKAWIHGTAVGGTPTDLESYNIASLDDDGVGLVGINISTDFAATTFCAVVGGERDSSWDDNTKVHARTVGTCDITIRLNANFDGIFNALMFGDQ